MMSNCRALWMLGLLWSIGLAGGSAVGAPPAGAALPRLALWGEGVVDDPQGPYYSCGLTLEHLGRDRAMIRRFHAYMAAQKLTPASLADGAPGEPPATTTHLILEPELLATDKLPTWGWTKEGAWLAGGAGDDGPTVHVPLSIPKTGTYLVGIRFKGSTQHTGVTGFKLYRRGREADGPLVADEFNNRPAASNGWVWHELVVTLEAGDYEIQLPHIIRQWHAPQTVGYGPRQVECFYLTDALWQDLPDEAALDALRARGTAQEVQTTVRVPLAAEARATWAQWQVRPVGWGHARNNPRLFALSYAFWRRQVAALAADADTNTRDYREPARQIIFDDVWNLVGTPWRLAEQIRALSSDVNANVKSARHYLKGAGAVDERTGGAECDWWPQADKVVSGTPYNFQGELIYSQTVEPGHTYSFWVQFRDIGLFEPWQIWAWWQGDPTNTLHWKRDKREYPPDIEPQRAWMKVGEIEVPATATNRVIGWRVRDLPWNGLYAVSYRWIHNFMITSDPTFSPKGTVMPAASAADYLGKAASVGGRKEAGILCQVAGDQPLPMDWWPASSAAMSNAVHMPRDAYHAFQIGMRGLVEEPVAVGVTCEPLKGPGGSYADRITWRVPAYVPYGATRATWAAWCLLRRPFVTVPPRQVAAVHLQIDTRGMTPGDYEARVALQPVGRTSGKPYPPREALIRVRVSPVAIAPAKPVLVHGYTMPPEGEAYLQDYQDHGLKVWCGPIISKDEMRRRGMRMQQVRARVSDGNYRPMVQSIEAAGLTPEDYYVIVWDEPSGTTEAELGQFIMTAKYLKEFLPTMPRVFNPGEAAVLKTFELLNPYCELWMPYTRHFDYLPQEAAAKTAIITSKPWMDYTTPCYEDKEPKVSRGLYDQIRRVPGAPGQCLGTWFFALYYPFQDPWDTEHEFLRDTSVFVLPSTHGPVATFAWETVRAAIQTTDLAMMVKERAEPGDEAAQALIRTGSMPSLLTWLEARKE